MGSGFEIRFALNKGNRFKRCDEDSPDSDCEQNNFLRGLDGPSSFCIEVLSCTGPDCFDTIEECLYDIEADILCVVPREPGVCCSFEEGAWNCVSNNEFFDDCLGGSYINNGRIFAPLKSCDYCSEISSNIDEVDFLSGLYGVRSVTRAEYNSAIHVIISGPHFSSEACFLFLSSSSSSEEFYGGCDALECGCDFSLGPCYYMDCGLVPGGNWVPDCDLCKCVELGSSSSSLDCSGFSFATASCPSIEGMNFCSYLKEVHENGCPKFVDCGVLVNGECVEWDGSFPVVSSSSSSVVSSSSSSSVSCVALPVVMPMCEPLPGVPLSDNCMYVLSYYDNGCPYVYSCGVLVDGVCVEWVPGSSSVSSVSPSSASSVPGGGSVDGSVGVALESFVCARRRAAGLLSGLSVPELGTIVPTYTQSSVFTGCTPARSGEMMNNTVYDSSYPIYQTMMLVQSSGGWVLADYGVVGRFKKVRVGPPPCALMGAKNGAGSINSGGCDGSYYLGATVQYSVDGRTWFFVGQTTSAPFLNAERTLVGTELVGDDELKEARYIRIFSGSAFMLGVSELHAARLDEDSSSVFSGDSFCLTLSEFDSEEFEVVSGPYPNSWSCEDVCGDSSSSSSSS
jgi:hypothetical protein